MRRCEFIKASAGLSIAWPIVARAQPRSKLATVGFMGAGASSICSKWVDAFLGRLREHGWIEDHTVAIEYRWAEGSYERASEIAAEFVRMNVDLIVTASTPNTLATKKAMSEIPIIFASAGDPVGGGLVASLARPGGNVTGLSIQAAETTGKRIELLREALHPLSRLGDHGQWRQVQLWLKCVRLRQLQRSSVSTQLRSKSGALKTSGLHSKKSEGTLTRFSFLPSRWQTNRRRISSFALAMHLPPSFGSSEYVEAGGLMSYRANFPDLYRRTADFVDKILRGAKPAENRAGR